MGLSLHHHGYLWSGPKSDFDQEGLRRPPHPQPPSSGADPELIRRHREAAAEFPVSPLPPIETAHWLLKPPGVVQGTWQEPEDAAAWLGERLAEYAARFAYDGDRAADRRAALVNAAAERLRGGGDVSYGWYLGRPAFLSVALVTCSPNAAAPGAVCPLPGAPRRPGPAPRDAP